MFLSECLYVHCVHTVPMKVRKGSPRTGLTDGVSWPVGARHGIQVLQDQCSQHSCYLFSAWSCFWDRWFCCPDLPETDHLPDVSFECWPYRYSYHTQLYSLFLPLFTWRVKIQCITVLCLITDAWVPTSAPYYLCSCEQLFYFLLFIVSCIYLYFLYFYLTCVC